MRRYRVIKNFEAQEVNGRFVYMINTGEELSFTSFQGDEPDEIAVFEILIDRPDRDSHPGKKYEVPRKVFEGSTELRDDG
jgi:hypothetical protein